MIRIITICKPDVSLEQCNLCGEETYGGDFGALHWNEITGQLLHGRPAYKKWSALKYRQLRRRLDKYLVTEEE